jgi:hypothetical protein
VDTCETIQATIVGRRCSSIRKMGCFEFGKPWPTKTRPDKLNGIILKAESWEIDQGKSPIIGSDLEFKLSISTTSFPTLIPRGLYGGQKIRDKVITSPFPEDKPGF